MRRHSTGGYSDTVGTAGTHGTARFPLPNPPVAWSGGWNWPEHDRLVVEPQALAQTLDRRDLKTIPLSAHLVVVAIEHAGHRMIVEGADIVIKPGVGLDVHLLAELRRWKPHAIMLLGYTADDSHLRTVVGSGTTGAAS